MCFRKYRLGCYSIGIEIKSATEWRREFGKGLKDLLVKKKIQKAYGVYRGNRAIMDSGLKILPMEQFSKHLFEGKIFH